MVVAVIDTGCDVTHPDLSVNVWTNAGEIPGNGIDDDHNGFVDDVTGWDFFNHDPDVSDTGGHGTHVAGTIAAAGNNGLGIVGVAWEAKVMAVKGLGDQGSGNSDDLAKAVLYAAGNGAKIINMSWGGSGFSQTMEDAFIFANSLNVSLVAAAGNNNMEASSFFPANSRHVITVGSSDHNDLRSDFSNFSFSVDVVAPGGDSSDSSSDQIFNNILSLLSSAITGQLANPMFLVGENYLRARGTSMAAPHVAGLAAGGGFSSYAIQYQDSSSTEWRSDGITLADGGARKVRDGIMGTWNTANIDRASLFRLRLVVKRAGLSDVVKETRITIDPDLHSGWPQRIPPLNYLIGRLVYLENVTAADIDRDG